MSVMFNFPIKKISRVGKSVPKLRLFQVTVLLLTCPSAHKVVAMILMCITSTSRQE